jgi:hypothetical protein
MIAVSMKAVRGAIRDGFVPKDHLSCVVDGASFGLQHGWPAAKVDMNPSEVTFWGSLEAPGVDALDGLRCEVSFNRLDWWQTLKQDAALDAEAEAIGVLTLNTKWGDLKHRWVAPVTVAIHPSPELLAQLYDLANAVLHDRIVNVWVSIDLNMHLPDNDKQGKDLEFLWVKGITLKAYGDVHYVDPRGK